MEKRDDNERLIYCATTHWVKYVPNACKNTFLMLIGIVLLSVSHIAIVLPVAEITCISGGLLILYAHHHLFHKILSESMYDIFVTSERIIYFNDSLFFANNEHEIPLHRIAGIEANQEGIVQNMLNYGTVWIDTGGSTIDFKRSIPHVPSPEEFSENVAQLVHNEGKPSPASV